MPTPDLLQDRQVRIIDLTGGREGIRLSVLAYATPEDLLAHAIEGREAARVRGEPPPDIVDLSLRRAMTHVAPVRRA